MLRGELVHKRIAYLSGRVDFSDRRSSVVNKRARKCLYSVAIIRQVTGPRVNRGAGYRMEVPCIYRPYRRQRYVDRAKEAILKLLNDCLL